MPFFLLLKLRRSRLIVRASEKQRELMPRKPELPKVSLSRESQAKKDARQVRMKPSAAEDALRKEKIPFGL